MNMYAMAKITARRFIVVQIGAQSNVMDGIECVNAYNAHIVFGPSDYAKCRNELIALTRKPISA